MDLVAEIERVIDTPLTGLMATEEERAVLKRLSAQALAAPAMIRLAQVIAFVGRGRPATQTGNLKSADAVALASQLGLDQPPPARVGSIDDLPDTAHAFRWAAAAEFLEWRGSRVLAAHRAVDFDRDPLSVWLKAAVTLLEHGLLDGFRQGWRKRYVELLDENVDRMLVVMVEAGAILTLSAIEVAAWEQVASAYGYDPDDQAERAHVVRLAHAMVAQLVDLGAVTRRGDRVVLTELGGTIAAMVSLSAEFDDDDELDLVDTDALSLLSVCVEDPEMTPGETRDHLLAWTQARPDAAAAAELCEAMLEDDDPALWALGLDALGMLDPAVAVPAVRGLRSHADPGPLVTDWLRRRSKPDPPQR
ncbi:MAG TPA: hypothetical protein VG405_04660 [Solirubrobacteraceae bacterium]|nr:hypothetical protein [Solirubrobacteraceae bacterium]